MKKHPIYGLLGVIATSLLFTACESNDDEEVQYNFVDPPSDPSTSTSANNAPTSDVAQTSKQNQYEAEIFTKINIERNSRSHTDLRRVPLLDSLASAHNIYMSQQAPPNSNPILISHDNARDRASVAFGYGFVSYGENVAGIRGYASNNVSDRFVLNWINSPGHYKNITGNFTVTGLDVLVAADGTVYATQLFAKDPEN